MFQEFLADKACTKKGGGCGRWGWGPTLLAIGFGQELRESLSPPGHKAFRHRPTLTRIETLREEDQKFKASLHSLIS